MGSILKLNWHKSINFGDQLNPYLVKRMWGFESKKINEGDKQPHLMMIGSILNEANSETLVLGSGFVAPDRYFESTPNIITVRGRKTLEMIENIKIKTDEIEVGDPAILLPDYFIPSVGFNKYNIGVIPHIIDVDFAHSLFERKRGVRIIDLRLSGDDFNEIESIINQICSCRCIISSSLHGLIIAHAYGIPGIWCEFSDMVIGNGFKFKDYMSAHGMTEDQISCLNLKNYKSRPYVSEIEDSAKKFIINSNNEKQKMREIIEKTQEIIISNKKKYLL